MSPVHIEPVHDLKLEVAMREVSGRALDPNADQGRPARLLLGLPAVLLLLVLLVPIVWTIVWALRSDTPLIGNLLDVVTDHGALAAWRNSLVWVVIALVVIALGYGIAVISRHVHELWRVLLYILILPFGVSALVSGAVFRIIFDPRPERGVATALFGEDVVWLGPGLIWLVLASSFAWTWLGFVVVLFRAGLKARPHTGPGLLGHPGLPSPGPVTYIVLLTVLVAAIRVFDLVLIAAPGSMRDDLDVVGLHWWRMTSRSGDTGAPAALALLLFVIVGLLSLTLMRRQRRTAPDNAAPAPAGDDGDTSRPPPARRRWPSWLFGIGLGALWLLPVVIVLATAFHDPRTAGSSGWWRWSGLGFGSFADVSASWLWPAVLGSLFLAGLATALVVAAAVPLAYLLTWGGLPSWLTRGLTTLLVVLAVAPVQMYGGPLGDLFGEFGLAGARTPLALVHAAAGLPFATLVLRTAFQAAPPDPSGTRRPTLDAIWHGRYLRALVAVGVLEFVLVWNDFIVGFLISGPQSTPLNLLLWGEARQFGIASGTVSAGAVVASVIPVTVLLVTWRKVISGLTGGATE
jgi:alpha-glucoside transport system permease protein